MRTYVVAGGPGGHLGHGTITHLQNGRDVATTGLVTLFQGATLVATMNVGTAARGVVGVNVSAPRSAPFRIVCADPNDRIEVVGNLVNF